MMLSNHFFFIIWAILEDLNPSELGVHHTCFPWSELGPCYATQKRPYQGCVEMALLSLLMVVVLVIHETGIEGHLNERSTGHGPVISFVPDYNNC